MQERRLKIGRIPFTNLFPIFYALDHLAVPLPCEFVDGSPSDLNRAIRDGAIDISPSSSIEYLRRHADYVLIDNHSISCSGRIGSILLFSKRPIGELGGRSICTTTQSETSVALLRIIMERFFGIRALFRSGSGSLRQELVSHDAYLLIGDNALREAKSQPDTFVFDLGEIWYEHTGLPFTFALWIASKKISAGAPDLLSLFTSHLDQAKEAALRDLPSIARFSPLRGTLSAEEIVSYWRGISYDFEDRHRKGLDLFRGYAAELDLLS